MTTYVGQVSTQSGDPLGPITVSLGPSGTATGNMRIGAPPAQGLTGFSGTWDADGFNAAGDNNRQYDPADPFDDIHLAAEVEGAILGSEVAGTIAAKFNSAPQSWTFSAFDIDSENGRSLLAAQEHAERGIIVGTVADAGGAVVEGGKKTAGFFGMVWDKIPGPAKLAAGAGLAYLGYRRFVK